jgi:hypothetical protein
MLVILWMSRGKNCYNLTTHICIKACKQKLSELKKYENIIKKKTCKVHFCLGFPWRIYFLVHTSYPTPRVDYARDCRVMSPGSYTSLLCSQKYFFGLTWRGNNSHCLHDRLLKVHSCQTNTKLKTADKSEK